jgi:hypothetical protein
MIVTGCWLTLKEMALLLGCLAREAPLAKQDKPEQSFFEAQQLATMGERLMHFMGVIKHNGAVEKAQAGFIALSERQEEPLLHHETVFLGPYELKGLVSSLSDSSLGLAGHLHAYMEWQGLAR